MKNQIIKKCAATLLNSLFLLSLCGFTSFSKKIDVPGGQFEGSETEEGIVLRFDSTAKDVFRESSDNIKFSSMFSVDKDIIDWVKLPIDPKPKLFTLKHDKFGFSGEITNMILSFHNRSALSRSLPPGFYGQFDGVTLFPFGTPKDDSKEELHKFLDEWVEKIDNAGWTRHWNFIGDPLQIGERSRNVYMNWFVCDERHLYQITLLTTYQEIFKPQYHVIIELTDVTKYVRNGQYIGFACNTELTCTDLNEAGQATGE